MLLLKL